MQGDDFFILIWSRFVELLGVKDVEHFKKFAWVQEENAMFKQQFHGGLADKTNHITLKKSELKAAWDSSWEGPLPCPFLSQAPASGHCQRHGPEGPLDWISTAFSVLPIPTWYCSLWDSTDCLCFALNHDRGLLFRPWLKQNFYSTHWVPVKERGHSDPLQGHKLPGKSLLFSSSVLTQHLLANSKCFSIDYCNITYQQTFYSWEMP